MPIALNAAAMRNCGWHLDSRQLYCARGQQEARASHIRQRKEGLRFLAENSPDVMVHDSRSPQDHTERTGVVKPDLGIVGTDATGERGGYPALLRPHLHLLQLLPQRSRPPRLRAEELDQLPAKAAYAEVPALHLAYMCRKCTSAALCTVFGNENACRSYRPILHACMDEWRRDLLRR